MKCPHCNDTGINVLLISCYPCDQCAAGITKMLEMISDQCFPAVYSVLVGGPDLGNMSFTFVGQPNELQSICATPEKLVECLMLIKSQKMKISHIQYDSPAFAEKVARLL